MIKLSTYEICKSYIAQEYDKNLISSTKATS